ncbi:MAG: hydroxylamine oxidase, partial [Desulfobacterales bacterium]
MKGLVLGAAVTGLMGVLLFSAAFADQDNEKISQKSRQCLGCHESATPAIVSDWKNSRMSKTTPKQAREKSELARRVSFENLSEELADSVVGCAECHTLNPDDHADSFEHAGSRVYTVVTPENCAVCHPEERRQYSDNIMSEAHGNL